MKGRKNLHKKFQYFYPHLNWTSTVDIVKHNNTHDV